MSNEKMQAKFLKDYKKPDYYIDTVSLVVELDDTRTKVSSRLNINRNSDISEAPIILDADKLEFISAKVDGIVLTSSDYELTDKYLKIFKGKDNFILEIENVINPSSNKALEGLYKSGSMFCTQNEPEGFRRITYYIDRPDVMAKFTTKIIGDKKLYPVLLSNGNLIERGELADGKHFATWFDPFNKPAYLYALVAGDLGMIKDEFKTISGRTIDLRVYCDKGNERKCQFAMESLKKSMKWDEDTYGLEYDLDIFMIVAVDSFNMGAMENKGLNIFNSALVLADSKTATDYQFQRIEGVVGHEYFHNYTGNRVTCRDWFQLTLKEGLTVFRDQEFSSDMNSRSVQRIRDVEGLRELQFAEDAGPTKHPIKPDSFIEINNFYTPTVYEKGSEIIRMIHTLLGKEGFRKGIDKYFELYDGLAVTTGDFIHAMSIANSKFDFTQFENTWYKRAGTPELKVSSLYDAEKQEYKVIIKQSLDAGQTPYHMPYKIGLVDDNGKDLNIKLEYLEIKNLENEFIFSDIASRPLLSLNRDFSAPVNTKYESSYDESINLYKSDNNQFSRYEIGRKLVVDIVLKYIKDENVQPSHEYINAWGEVLNDQSVDAATKALLLSLPTDSFINQSLEIIPFKKVYDGLQMIKKVLANTYKEELLKIYNNLNKPCSYKFIPSETGNRALKHEILSFLMSLNDTAINELCFNQLKNASNMTDEYSAFELLVSSDVKQRDEVVDLFYNKWHKNSLVLISWMKGIANSSHPDTLNRIYKIINSEDYDKTVPNIIRAIQRTFGRNMCLFHDLSGNGYKFIADSILELDSFNPSISSGLCKLFMDFKRIPSENRVMMEKELLRIQKKENLSKNTFEIVNKILF